MFPNSFQAIFITLFHSYFPSCLTSSPPSFLPSVLPKLDSAQVLKENLRKLMATTIILPPNLYEVFLGTIFTTIFTKHKVCLYIYRKIDCAGQCIKTNTHTVVYIVFYLHIHKEQQHCFSIFLNKKSVNGDDCTPVKKYQ